MAIEQKRVEAAARGIARTVGWKGPDDHVWGPNDLIEMCSFDGRVICPFDLAWAALRAGFHELASDPPTGWVAPTPEYGPEAAPMTEEQRKWIASKRKSISAEPALMSLLYDLDRLPEQVVSARAAYEMMLIILHFEQAVQAARDARTKEQGDEA